MTDADFFYPTAGDSERQPKKRFLIVEGTGASTATGTIQVNGTVAFAKSDGSWRAFLPVTSPGSITITAKDDDSTVSSTTTAIDLQVVSPKEGASLPLVSDPPAMPKLNAEIDAVGYPGDLSAVSFDWTLSVRGEQRQRDGWHHYKETAGQGTTLGAEPWAGPHMPIIGGVGRLSATADIPGVLHEPVRSEPRWIDIPGSNPGKDVVKGFVDRNDPANAPVEVKIFCWESGHTFNQFNPAANTGRKDKADEPATKDVPSDYAPNPPTQRPNFGGPPAGIGVAQDDPASFPKEQWNWQANVRRGILIYQEGHARAARRAASEQARLDQERDMAINDIKEKLGKVVFVAPAVVPPLSAEQQADEAIRQYNQGPGAHEWFFDETFMVSPRGEVTTVGSGRWKEAVGDWQSRRDWVAAGGPNVARLYIPNAKNPDYVNNVKGCHD